MPGEIIAGIVLGGIILICLIMLLNILNTPTSYIPIPKIVRCKGCRRDITGLWNVGGYGWCCVQHWRTEQVVN